MNAKGEYLFLDLFCGVGGFSLGFVQEGFKCLEAYDFWDDAICTYNHNFGGGGMTKDLTQYPLRLIPTSQCGVDVLIGSPPCVNFSTTNPNGDVRDGLLLMYRFLEIVCYVKPKLWVMENVPQISKYLPSDFAPIKVVLNSANFGVPQTRERCFFGSFPIPSSTHAKETNLLGLPRWVKARHVLEQWLDRQDLDDYVLPKTPSRERMLNDDVVNLDKPSPTITCKQDRKPTFLLPYKGSFRFITPRETAILMGFPSTFEFLGNDSTQYKQIGNAVCPPISRALARACKEALMEKVEVHEQPES